MTHTFIATMQTVINLSVGFAGISLYLQSVRGKKDEFKIVGKALFSGIGFALFYCAVIHLLHLN